MKNYIYLLLIILASCTDVVNVTVPTAEPRLIIEASIDWEKGTEGNNQTIKLSTSTPYFNTTFRAVTGASVKVINTSSMQEFLFTDQNNGNYSTNNFIPIIGQTYRLEVVYNNEAYTATETMVSVPDILQVSQSKEGGLDDSVPEVKVFFQDPEAEDNQYLLRFQEKGDLLPTLFDLDDKFINGNIIDVFFEKFEDEDTNVKEFEQGDVVFIALHGISEKYYNYIKLLIEQNESAGDPFSTIPAPIKGNCVNITDPDNYAFGYFRLTQVVKTTYIFQ